MKTITIVTDGTLQNTQITYQGGSLSAKRVDLMQAETELQLKISLPLNGALTDDEREKLIYENNKQQIDHKNKVEFWTAMEAMAKKFKGKK
jgi:hypothetical protein